MVSLFFFPAELLLCKIRGIFNTKVVRLLLGVYSIEIKLFHPNKMDSSNSTLGHEKMPWDRHLIRRGKSCKLLRITPTIPAWVSVSVSDDEYHTCQPNWRQAEFLACPVVRTPLGVWTPALPQQPRTDGSFHGCACKYER
jgi:hypothetical protein